MSHQSEQCVPLIINKVEINNVNDIKTIDPSNPAVWLFILPYNPSCKEIKIDKGFINCLETFISRANNETVICFLSSAQTSAELLLILHYYIL